MYVNPYADLNSGKWRRANFHTHAGTGPNTCGRNSIEAVVEQYRELGYDTLCISNHDLYSDTSVYSDDRITLIDGVEYTGNVSHMLTIGVERSLFPLTHQQAIDETASDGGFTILCHPNWIKKEYWPWNELLRLKGYIGIEIINMLIYRLNGSGLATDSWDYVLSNGKLIYGFGNDDMHLLSDVGRSWNEIYAKAAGFDEIAAAVKKGAFTASTGLTLEFLLLEGRKLTVKAAYPKETYVKNLTYRFVTDGGQVAATVYGEAASYTLTNEAYVRVEVEGENGALLFTQPVYDNSRLIKIF